MPYFPQIIAGFSNYCFTLFILLDKISLNNFQFFQIYLKKKYSNNYKFNFFKYFSDLDFASLREGGGLTGKTMAGPPSAGCSTSTSSAGRWISTSSAGLWFLGKGGAVVVRLAATGTLGPGVVVTTSEAAAAPSSRLAATSNSGGISTAPIAASGGRRLRECGPHRTRRPHLPAVRRAKRGRNNIQLAAASWERDGLA